MFYRDPANRAQSPNKIVCFTRSSSLVHGLPCQFNTNLVQQDPPDTRKIVCDIIFDKADKVVVCKLSSFQSQSSVQELLKAFVISGTSEVCVLLANMQETTTKMINHLRVMIEEAEIRVNKEFRPLNTEENNSPTESSRTLTEAKFRHPQCCKLFILLLHFPPAQLYKHCYQALFLRGWDYCYLDTIAHSTEKGRINTEDWFLSSYFPNYELGAVENTLSELFPQIASLVSARVLRIKSNRNASQYNIDTLLTKTGLDKVLCGKFRAYWEPKVMAEYLERAATYSKLRESTLNITDTIQTQLKSLFTDFCVYMLIQAFENFNFEKMDSLNDTSKPIYKLFFGVLSIFPVPELHQLKFILQSDNTISPQYYPLFPFFHFVYELIEKYVLLRKNSLKRERNLLADDMHLPLEDSNPAEELIQKVLSDLSEDLDQVNNVFNDLHTT